MNTVEVERINNYVKDMNDTEAQNLVRCLPADLMYNELARRESLKSSQLEAIGKILQAE